ncbi:MAG: M28 family metallopeptidase [Acidobacteria bacterium]|nr:M28 family metallopeptidase [Acidobacteriota bacterium]MBS1864734.1 M28 family metallopeptidase [Acidobacteriota bacterium]
MNLGNRKQLVPVGTVALGLLLVASTVRAQEKTLHDPGEPLSGASTPKILPRPAGAIPRSAFDEKTMREIIHEQVSCGTRLTLSSWTDPKRGAGCGRDFIVARFNEIAKHSGGKLEVVVDKFEMMAERTGGKPVHLENVYGILKGSDPKLANTVFIVDGDFDSRPSDVMDPNADAPGADDDSSGVAVMLESARLLSKAAAEGHGGRATVIFAAFSGEEQGLLGSYHMLDWVKEKGYTVGGMMDNDIVGADPAPGGPHRVRVFSGNGEIEDADSPSRELARAVEEIAGRDAVRMIFRVDRYGRGGDHYVFYKAGLPAVRFTEPLEDYNHQHQTPRTENGVEYGDLEKYLNFAFMGNVARDNAEALRQLALAPAPPMNVRLYGAVTPDAKLKWTAEEDSERAGFEILWRETTEARWSVYDFVTDEGEHALKGVSTDNHFFAVRSVGKNGARSIATASQPEVRRAPIDKK